MKKAQARTFFESTAPGLKLPDFSRDPKSDTVGTKSLLDLDAAALIPEWDKAARWELDHAQVVETPIRAAGIILAQTRFGDEPYTDQSVEAILKLVVENRPQTAEQRYFVATIVPTEKYVTDHGKETTQSLSARPDPETGFSGLVVFSQVDGTFLLGVRYLEGVPIGQTMPRWLTEQKGLLEKVDRSYKLIFQEITTKGGGGDDQ